MVYLFCVVGQELLAEQSDATVERVVVLWFCSGRFWLKGVSFSGLVPGCVKEVLAVTMFCLSV
jgi:hypothetical protein